MSGNTNGAFLIGPTGKRTMGRGSRLDGGVPHETQEGTPGDRDVVISFLIFQPGKRLCLSTMSSRPNSTSRAQHCRIRSIIDPSCCPAFLPVTPMLVLLQQVLVVVTNTIPGRYF
jgi:hypothetical protein